MKITIENTTVNTRSGTSARTGKDYNMRSQQAFLRGDRVAGEITLMLGDKQEAYPLGDYDLDLERSISIGNFGSLRFVPVLKAEMKSAMPFSKTA